MYDVTDAKSFQNIAKWLKDTREKADENVKCLLVRKSFSSLASKCDMPNKIPRLR